MSGIITTNRLLVSRIARLIHRKVSTSPKNNDTAAASLEAAKAKASSEPSNWITYGFDTKSKTDDRRAAHSIFFTSVTLCIMVGGYFFAYLPDYSLKEWSTREAFLELRRREKAGLPLIDPNLIDPALIELPSDEELGDTEIII